MQFDTGDIYLFINRRGDRIKLLVWDGDGFWIYYKRLEKGTFRQALPMGRKSVIRIW
ncbi:MAG: IS66 family insertion sequence element accessory protein TnpB [Candidatus Marinimicrobia bacterium]|nr:IS66 family insertion sequence element accessory protein TnpB [Candidatus Neomarinimicrobiota bacterium]